MDTISFENLVAFAVGMAVVYMMFRGMGVFVLAAFITISAASAQAQVAVTNWPDTNSPLPVFISQQSSPDVWPSAAAGFSFGLTVCGFGMILRMAKRTGLDT